MIQLVETVNNRIKELSWHVFTLGNWSRVTLSCDMKLVKEADETTTTVASIIIAVGSFNPPYKNAELLIFAAMLMWTKAGDLVTARSAHNVISDGNYLLVIGGQRNNMSEKCSIENGQVTCSFSFLLANSKLTQIKSIGCI